MKPLLETMHQIASDCPLADGVFGVCLRPGDHWLMPLTPYGVEQVNWDRVLASAEGHELPGFLEVKQSGTVGNRVMEVDFRHNGAVWAGRYPTRSRDPELGGGNTLDVRVWPNFYFPVLPRLPIQDGDRIYYFRVRQREQWKLGRPRVLARLRDDAGIPIRCALLDLREGEEVPQDPEAFRQARFYWMPARYDDSDGHAEPIGLYFEGRGLLLTHLHNLPFAGHRDGVLWRVGIDFGTSNTCVAWMPVGHTIAARPVREPLSIQTATMHSLPIYEKVNASNPGMETEGAAAIFDFPYRYADEDRLTERDHFPSQFVTRLKEPPQGEPSFRFVHGLVFPRNGVLDNLDARELLDSYPPLPKKEFRVFRLIHDVKWKNRGYRRSFLWHLYKTLVFHAARKEARIKEVRISYPRAFTPDAIRAYREEVREIFEQHGGIEILDADFMSESVAVQHFFSGLPPNADRLVLDVGGGTTDLTGLPVRAEAFQASYQVAARQINDYFSASPAFRESLKTTAYDVIGAPQSKRQERERRLLDDLLNELKGIQRSEFSEDTSERIASYSQGALFGLLGMLDDHQFSNVGCRLTDPGKEWDEESQRALFGFFLTIVLLYAGLAYEAARLLRQHGRRALVLDLSFIGNGSRFLTLLDLPDRPGSFHGLIEQVVQAAGPNPRAKVTMRVSPEGKAYVAEGLVVATVDLPPAPVLPDLSAQSQFKALVSGQDPSSAVTNNELSDFVRLVSRLLPNGRANTDGLEPSILIPGCPKELAGTLAPLATRATARARKLAMESAREWDHWQRQAATMTGINSDAENLHREAAHAVEPVFITCLRCLLDEVRDRYSM